MIQRWQIKEWSTAHKLIVGVLSAGVLIIFVLFLWYRGTQIWNGIGNYFFHKQINAERVKVQKDLDDAAAQKQVLEQTLKELAEVKKDYADVKAEKDRLETFFNDQSKTAAEKVTAFKASLVDDPERTSTDNVTTESLCERARAIGSSPATIAALCGQ